MAAKHWNPTSKSFEEKSIDVSAQDDFPYELPNWMKSYLEEYPEQNEEVVVSISNDTYLTKKVDDNEYSNDKILTSLHMIDKVMKYDGSITINNPGLGDVIYANGTIGNIEKARNGGFGIKHVIEGRYLKDNMSNEDITSLLHLIKDTVETVEPEVTEKNRINLQKNGIWVGIAKSWLGTDENWIVTGFGIKEENQELTKEAIDSIKAVSAQYGYAPEFLSISKQVGAITSNIDSTIRNIKMSNDSERINNFRNIYKYSEVVQNFFEMDIHENEASYQRDKDEFNGYWIPHHNAKVAKRGLEENTEVETPFDYHGTILTISENQSFGEVSIIEPAFDVELLTLEDDKLTPEEKKGDFTQTLDNLAKKDEKCLAAKSDNYLPAIAAKIITENREVKNPNINKSFVTKVQELKQKVQKELKKGVATTIAISSVFAASPKLFANTNKNVILQTNISTEKTRTTQEQNIYDIYKDLSPDELMDELVRTKIHNQEISKENSKLKSDKEKLVTQNDYYYSLLYKHATVEVNGKKVEAHDGLIKGFGNAVSKVFTLAEQTNNLKCENKVLKNMVQNRDKRLQIEESLDR